MPEVFVQREVEAAGLVFLCVNLAELVRDLALDVAERALRFVDERRRPSMMSPRVSCVLCSVGRSAPTSVERADIDADIGCTADDTPVLISGARRRGER